MIRSILLFLLLLIAIPAEARDFWVHPSGFDTNPCTDSATALPATGSRQTIQALNACSLGPGDIVHVQSGTYAALRGTNNGGTLPSGASGKPITFTAVNQYGPRIPYAEVNPYWVIDGFTVDVTGILGSGSTQNEGVGGSDLILKNSEIMNCPAQCILGGSNNTIQNNKIHNAANNPSNADCTGAKAGQCHLIYLTGNNNIVEHNELYDIAAGYGGWAMQFYSGSTSNNIVRYNLMYNFTAGGIVLAYPGVSTNNQVYGNVIRDGRSGSSCMTNMDGSGHVFYNNTCYNTPNGLSTGVAGSVTVRNNIFSNVPGTDYGGLAIPSAYTSTNNICDSVQTRCGSAATAAQLFVNPTTRDLHLNATSPAINAGVNLGSTYSPDITGTPRPGGSSPWSLGAYEYAVPPPPPGTQLVLALPLDAGSGSTATDVSGQNNNATLVGGATWDNAGKYGKAVMFDGTGYLNVPATSSLALASGMTLEAWVYPTVAPSGNFFSVIFKDSYFLYASSESGYCPALVSAPLGGYSSTTDQQYLCATSAPPPNQWSHLAVTHDGTTTTFYLDGKTIATRTATDPMATSSANLTLGASIYGEGFIGKIDEPRVYNYARNPAQIVSDMNTPLIGVPGKYVEIAAPQSVEISAASTLEIGAD